MLVYGLSRFCTDVTMRPSIATVSGVICLICIIPASCYIEFCLKDIHVRSTSGRNDIPYGETLEMSCSGPEATNLKLTVDDVEVLTKEVNSSTIIWTGAPESIKMYKFLCYDEERRCANFGSIHVVPLVQITSPHTSGEVNIVQYGDPLEILCSGPEKETLTIGIGDLRRDELPAQAINRTTIKYFTNKPEIQDSHYFCHSSKYTRTDVHVVVDAPPEVVNFRYVSHNLELLNCTWMVLSERTNFTLFYVDDENHFHICTKLPPFKGAAFCTWYVTDHPSYPNDVEILSILVQACNDLGCVNQTFDIDHRSIIKPSPPPNLRVVSISSRNVQLEWDIKDIFETHDQIPDIDHKLLYWFSGIKPREADSGYCYGGCSTDLELPCPSKYYQVWLYVKPTGAGEEFWSDPASITFSTSADEDVVDPICEWEPKKTKQVMVYLINEFRRDLRDDMAPLRAKVDALKEKLAKIRELQKALK